jgi:hypothetical protein
VVCGCRAEVMGPHSLPHWAWGTMGSLEPCLLCLPLFLSPYLLPCLSVFPLHSPYVSLTPTLPAFCLCICLSCLLCVFLPFPEFLTVSPSFSCLSLSLSLPLSFLCVYLPGFSLSSSPSFLAMSCFFSLFSLSSSYSKGLT